MHFGCKINKTLKMVSRGKCQECRETCPLEELGYVRWFQYCRHCRFLAALKAIQNSQGYELSKNKKLDKSEECCHY